MKKIILSEAYVEKVGRKNLKGKYFEILGFASPISLYWRDEEKSWKGKVWKYMYCNPPLSLIVREIKNPVVIGLKYWGK